MGTVDESGRRGPRGCCEIEGLAALRPVGRVNDRIRSLDKYSFVVVLDLYALSQAMVDNPPVIFGHELVGPPAYGGFDHLFADTIHPTAVGNALIANAIIARINAKWGDDIPLYTEEELADLAHIPH